jgi:PAS domain S-box-containing protein
MSTLDWDATSKRPRAGVIAVSIAMAAAIFAFDVMLPLGVAGGVPYVALVLVGLWSPWRPLLFLLAISATMLTVVGYAISPVGGIEWMVLTNRGLALFAIWTTALLAFGYGQSELRLRDQEKRFQAVIDAAVDGIIMIDAGGNIENANPAIQTLFGYGVDQIVGQNVKLLMPEPDHSKHDDYLEAYLATGTAKVIGIGREVTGKRADGSTFPLDLSVNEMWLGKERKFVGILRDASERKKREESLRAAYERLDRQTTRLRESNQALADYASAASHDLKEPLRAIRNYADFLMEDLGDSVEAEQLTLLNGLTRAAKEAQELVDDLLSYAQVSTVAPTFEEVDLGRTVSNMVGALDLPDDAKVEVAKDWPSIPVSITLLRQIIQNLVYNGIKFNQSEQKIVQLASRSDADGMCNISIADNGIGIDSRHFEQIFQVFRRLHTRSEYAGTGIGLAIVQRAASRMGGQVRVESELGNGSTFVVSLPLNRVEDDDDDK